MPTSSSRKLRHAKPGDLNQQPSDYWTTRSTSLVTATPESTLNETVLDSITPHKHVKHWSATAAFDEWESQRIQSRHKNYTFRDHQINKIYTLNQQRDFKRGNKHRPVNIFQTKITATLNEIQLDSISAVGHWMVWTTTEKKHFRHIKNTTVKFDLFLCVVLGVTLRMYSHICSENWNTEQRHSVFRSESSASYSQLHLLTAHVSSHV